jgi:hypothetical protein
MKNAVKNLKHKNRPLPHHVETQPVVPRGPNWAMLAVIAVFTGLVTFGLCEYVLLSKLPIAMLGQWAVVPQDTDPGNMGATMEFSRNGSVLLKFPNSMDASGTARIEGDRLHVTVPYRQGRGTETITYLLISLNDKHMELEKEPVLIDGKWERGGQMKLKRPPEK